MGLSWGNSLASFNRKNEEAKTNMERETANAVSSAGRTIIRTAERNTPVRTGYLRSSWKKVETGSGENKKVDITNSADYASVVENGTRKTPPRRMLARAMVDGRRELDRKLKQARRRVSSRY